MILVALYIILLVKIHDLLNIGYVCFFHSSIIPNFWRRNINLLTA